MLVLNRPVENATSKKSLWSVIVKSSLPTEGSTVVVEHLHFGCNFESFVWDVDLICFLWSRAGEDAKSQDVYFT